VTGFPVFGLINALWLRVWSSKIGMGSCRAAGEQAVSGKLTCFNRPRFPCHNGVLLSLYTEEVRPPPGAGDVERRMLVKG
jgi:hypothetical protein